MWTKSFIVFFEYCSKNPVMYDWWRTWVNVRRSLPQWWSKMVFVSAIGAFYGANNSSFQTPSRQVQSETEKCCVAKFSCHFLFFHDCTLCAWVLGCLLLLELSCCKVGAGFSYFLFSPHWFVGFSLPTCLGLLWKVNRGSFKEVIDRDGADAVRNKRKLVRNWVC